MNRSGLIIICLLSALITRAQFWMPMGTGLESTPTAITSASNLIVAASPVAYENGQKQHEIQIYNGIFWRKLPPIFSDSNSIISALKFYNGHLYIGGRFESINGMPKSKNLIRWSLISKTYDTVPNIIDSLGSFEYVKTIEAIQGKLVIHGKFILNNSTIGSSLVFTDGEHIVTPLAGYGEGVNGFIGSISIKEGAIAVGGRLNYAGGDTAAQLAYFKGGVWDNVEINNTIPTHVEYFEDELYFAGYNFYQNQKRGIYRKDGINIDTINGNIDEVVTLYDLHGFNGNLYATGIFKIDGNPANEYLLRYDSGKWFEVEDSDLSLLVKMIDYQNRLVVTGTFLGNEHWTLNHIAQLITDEGLVKGKVYFDKNQNCLFDDDDKAINQNVVLVQPGNYYVKPDRFGEFSFLLKDGTYQLYLKTQDYWKLEDCDTPQKEVKIISGQIVDNQDFAVVRDVGINDLAVYLSSSSGSKVSQSEKVFYNLQYVNRGSADVANGYVVLYHDNQLSNFTSNPNPDFTNADSSVWNFSNLYSGQRRSVILSFDVSSSASNQIQLSAGIVKLENEDILEDNQSDLTQEIGDDIGYFSKDVLPISSYDTATIKTGQSFLDYQISFSNVTEDTIYTVRIIDTIKLSHSLTLIQELGASHPYETEVYPGLPGEDIGIIVWTFKDINLAPDPSGTSKTSVNKGHIRFRLGLDDNLDQGTMLTNQAHVVYDYFDPEPTNITYAQVKEISLGLNPIEQDSMVLFPNPCQNKIYFNTNTIKSKMVQISIYDLNGKLLLQQDQNLADSLDVSNLPNGLFFISIFNGESVQNQKFIKR